MSAYIFSMHLLIFCGGWFKYLSSNLHNCITSITRNLFVPIVPEDGIGPEVMLDGEDLL